MMRCLILALYVLMCSVGFAADSAVAAAISMGSHEEVSSNVYRFPVVVSNVSGLAGLDVEIGYDVNHWQFLQLRKCGKGGGFLLSHNTNEPGTIHVVMASPGGVDIKDGPILFVDFKCPEKEEPQILPAITAVKGMTGSLHPISFDF
jgi:hypothetical protein